MHNLKPVEIHVAPADVATALNGLGLTEDLLNQALVFGFGYRAECTLNDPSSAGGFLMWDKTTRMLRDLLIPQ